jgi:hypothetical protein
MKEQTIQKLQSSERVAAKLLVHLLQRDGIFKAKSREFLLSVASQYAKTGHLSTKQSKKAYEMLIQWCDKADCYPEDLSFWPKSSNKRG